MVILEGYSVGIPAAVTPFLGANEAVEHNKTGIIVSRRDYSEAVFRLLRDAKINGYGKSRTIKSKKRLLHEES